MYLYDVLLCELAAALTHHPGPGLVSGVAPPTRVAPRGGLTRCVASIVGDGDAVRQPQAVSAVWSGLCDFEAAVVAWRCVVDRVGRRRAVRCAVVFDRDAGGYMHTGSNVLVRCVAVHLNLPPR